MNWQMKNLPGICTHTPSDDCTQVELALDNGGILSLHVPRSEAPELFEALENVTMVEVKKGLDLRHQPTTQYTAEKCPCGHVACSSGNVRPITYGQGVMQFITAVEVAKKLNAYPDARRWLALLSCSRIRVLGYARGGPQGRDGAIRHIGFEFTTDQEPYCALEIEEARRLLKELADVIAAKETS